MKHLGNNLIQDWYKKTGQPEGMSRFTYCYFFRPGILTLPGLSSYPPVKIADRNAKQTPIIRITVMIGTSCKFISSFVKYTLF